MAPLTSSLIRGLAGDHGVAPGAWRSLIALRIGSAPPVRGAAVPPALERFLGGVTAFGRCGCDVLERPGHWLVETDLTLAGRRGTRPVPCVVAIRTESGLVKDLRFYLDLADGSDRGPT
jgi:hypothetical protein